MKTQVTRTGKRSITTLGLMLFLMMAFVGFSPIYGQTATTQNERTLKGVISNAEGPLESASIILKGTKTGATTNEKGEFTFPKPLKTGDVLLVSYLGYETAEFKIKDTTDFIKIQLTEDVLEFVGALNSDTPYKSKRSN
jgi:hypothetical protein